MLYGEKRAGRWRKGRKIRNCKASTSQALSFFLSSSPFFFLCLFLTKSRFFYSGKSPFTNHHENSEEFNTKGKQETLQNRRKEKRNERNDVSISRLSFTPKSNSLITINTISVSLIFNSISIHFFFNPLTIFIRTLILTNTKNTFLLKQCQHHSIILRIGRKIRTTFVFQQMNINYRILESHFLMAWRRRRRRGK